MSSAFVIVDGSNIATEGRSTPSLAQLDEAVRQFQEQFPGMQVIVVVDATFGHRIDRSERPAFDEAVAHGEITSPPAGAIGRGDAFLLRLAEKIGAQVLSNDSFQEFHGEHPWLFDEGRLVGGTPVRGVGWIFVPRSPVRGPRSRAARKAAKEVPAPSKRAAKGPEKLAAKSPRSRSGLKATTSSGKRESPAPSSKPTESTKAGVASSGVPAARKEAKATTTASLMKKAAKAAKATKAAKAAKGAKGVRAKKAPEAKVVARSEGVPAAKRPAKPKTAARVPKKVAQPEEAAGLAKATKVVTADKKVTKGASKAVKLEASAISRRATKISTSPPKAGPSRPAEGIRGEKPAKTAPAKTAPAKTTKIAREAIKAAIEAAAKEALVPPGGKESPSGRRRGRAPAAVNDPLTFLTFVSDHPIGAEVEGTVSSFTSHGAMVDVGEMHCYVPSAGLGDPAPRRAKEVLGRGERRRFILVALDPPRRGAQLALSGTARARQFGPAEPATRADRVHYQPKR